MSYQDYLNKLRAEKAARIEQENKEKNKAVEFLKQSIDPGLAEVIVFDEIRLSVKEHYRGAIIDFVIPLLVLEVPDREIIYFKFKANRQNDGWLTFDKSSLEVIYEEEVHSLDDLGDLILGIVGD